jgi:RNA polymerase primary sigma factor/RNA polymerase sigma factor
MAECSRKTLCVQVGGMCACRLAIEEGMEQHDGLVHAFIRRQGGGDIPYDEALQAGRIGLWRALKGYDPARGTAFSTYAWVAITRHIHRAAREINRELGDWPRQVPALWEEAGPEDQVERILTLEALGELVGRLPERSRRVVMARYGLGDQPPRTLKSVGLELGLTRERVRQLQQDALAWMRHPAHSLSLRQLLGRNTVVDYR